MNEKFYSLPVKKQQAIINAGYKVFSQNSYKNSPMSEIAEAAEISKSLLFHYFHNKKLTAVMVQIIAMNGIIFALSLLSIKMIGEQIFWKEILLMHLAYFLLQIELAGICFGVSAFLRHGSFGIGLGLAAVMYFLNLIANMTESVTFLKYITPFAYCEGADIIADGKLNGTFVGIGIFLAFIGISTAYIQYCKKDIR